MHLNYLAGLLPFFEPSIEFEEGLPNTPPHESHSHRSLHTFVPLPSANHPPTLASHGGLPTRLITNPELHLRPITAFSSHRSHSVPSYHSHHSSHPCTSSGPPTLPIHADSITDPHPEPRPLSDLPTNPSRTTIPVPVRSKQRSRTVDDPQPKKKSKSEEISVSRTADPPNSAHTHDPTLDNDDSDDSDSDPTYRLAALRSNKATSAPRPWQPWGKATSKASPPLAKAPPVAVTSTVTLTPNPHETTPTVDHSEDTREPATVLPASTAPILDRPWTASDDAQLTSMKQDTRSRPSWKTIGARLDRDPQLCKMRWALLKRADAEGRIVGPIEPETGD